jgi:hypothetical protein
MPKNTFAKTVINSVYVPACIRYWINIRIKVAYYENRNEGVHTGMRYKITFFKLSNTRRPNSIATGIEEKSLFNKMIEAD